MKVASMAPSIIPTTNPLIVPDASIVTGAVTWIM